MRYERATLTKQELEAAIDRARRKPHGDIHKGKLLISPEAYTTPGRETNICISPFSIIDCTGSIFLGPWSLIGARSRIYTHEHIHLGRTPLLKVQENHGLLWQDKFIGTDVWINDGAVVLYPVTVIPDGVFLGAGTVLTKNPGPYEIWAGVPGKRLGVRTDCTDKDIEDLLRQDEKQRFLVRDYLNDHGIDF